MFIWWTLVAVLYVVLVFFTARLAASKGHSPLAWGLLAVIIPVIALAIVAFLPDRSLA